MVIAGICSLLCLLKEQVFTTQLHFYSNLLCQQEEHQISFAITPDTTRARCTYFSQTKQPATSQCSGNQQNNLNLFSTITTTVNTLEYQETLRHHWRIFFKMPNFISRNKKRERLTCSKTQRYSILDLIQYITGISPPWKTTFVSFTKNSTLYY